MYETHVTVVGNVATPVKGWRLSNGDVVAKFRIASTERRRRGPGERWADGRTLFLGVTCWRQLAENVLSSFSVGDPVIVRGRLFSDFYEREGTRREDVELHAHTAGADLSRCRVAITRTRRGQGATTAPEEPVTATVHRSDDQPERLGAPVEAGVRA